MFRVTEYYVNMAFSHTFNIIYMFFFVLCFMIRVNLTFIVCRFVVLKNNIQLSASLYFYLPTVHVAK